MCTVSVCTLDWWPIISFYQSSALCTQAFFTQSTMPRFSSCSWIVCPQFSLSNRLQFVLAHWCWATRFTASPVVCECGETWGHHGFHHPCTPSFVDQNSRAPTHNQTLSNIPLYPFVTNTFPCFFEPRTLTLRSNTRVCTYVKLLSLHSSSIVDHALYVAVCVIWKVQQLMNAIVYGCTSGELKEVECRSGWWEGDCRLSWMSLSLDTAHAGGLMPILIIVHSWVCKS